MKIYAVADYGRIAAAFSTREDADLYLELACKKDVQEVEVDALAPVLRDGQQGYTVVYRPDKNYDQWTIGRAAPFFPYSGPQVTTFEDRYVVCLMAHSPTEALQMAGTAINDAVAAGIQEGGNDEPVD